jgi:hypothetical protein
MKLFGGVKLRSLVVATIVSSSMLFIACEKETASVLNPEQGVSNAKLSNSDALLLSQTV